MSKILRLFKWLLVIWLLFFVKVGVGQRFTAFTAIKYQEHMVEISIKSKILSIKLYKTVIKHQKIIENGRKLTKL